MNHFAEQLKLTQHCKSTILQLKKKKKVPGEMENLWFKEYFHINISGQLPRNLRSKETKSPRLYIFVLLTCLIQNKNI